MNVAIIMSLKLSVFFIVELHFICMVCFV